MDVFYDYETNVSSYLIISECLKRKKLEFDILDSNGTEYHRWVTDVETTFIGKEILSTIRAPDANTKAPPASAKTQALMFLRRHMTLP